jgi:hypothetical protein
MVRVAFVAALFAVTGCENDFVPRTLVDAYRVFGVVAEPPAVFPDSTVVLQVIDTGEPDLTYDWTVCPVSIGPLLNFECLDPALETHFVTDVPELTVDFGPDGVNLLGTLVTWFAGQGQAGSACDAECMARSMDRVLQVQFTVRTQRGTETLFTTVRTVRVQSDAVDLNTNPVIASLGITGDDDGRVAPGGVIDLRLEVAVDSLQSFTRSNGQTVIEEGQVSWYATSGDFDATFTFGALHENRLTLPANLMDDGVRVFVGLRDGRGGFAFAEQMLGLAP